MNFIIREINNNPDEIKSVKCFLYDLIKKEYGIGPTPKFHYDIENLEEYYVLPARNNLFIAFDGDKIIATVAIRGYDKDYEFFKNYSKENTASIWRLMVDEKYRRQGVARKLIEYAENFARDNDYREIYLNTHRYLKAAIAFWESLGYQIVLEEDDYDETNHMVKDLI